MKLTRRKVPLAEALTEHEAKVLLWLKRSENACELALAAMQEAIDTVADASEDCIAVSPAIWRDLFEHLDDHGREMAATCNEISEMGISYAKALAKAHRDETE